MKIGVFDSGVGGKSVANAISQALPDTEVILREDRKNLPYGDKSPRLLLALVTPILQELVDDGCAVIVVACNTVSTTLIEQLRTILPVPLVATEPMVKPATEMTKSRVIAVCATPTTLASKRYAWLKDTYAKGIKVIEPDCSDWTRMIEDNAVSEKIIGERIEEAVQDGADVIVLGCTHYHWIEELITKIASGRAKVIQPELALIAQLKRVLGN